MIRLIGLFAVILLISGCAQNNREPLPPPDNTIAVGTVVDVNWPAQWRNHDYNIGNGDLVSGRFGWYRPPGSTANYQVKDDYNVIIIKKPISHAATYIIFDPLTVDPDGVQKLLGRIDGEIKDVDMDEGTIKPGDIVFITISDYHGLNKIGLDFRRGEYNDPLAEVSFINRFRNHRIDPLDPAAPYIPYISEIE